MGVVFSNSPATQQEHTMTNQVNPLIKQLEKSYPHTVISPSRSGDGA